MGDVRTVEPATVATGLPACAAANARAAFPGGSSEPETIAAKVSSTCCLTASSTSAGSATLPGRRHVPAQRRHDRAHVRAQTSDRKHGGRERQRATADERSSSHHELLPNGGVVFGGERWCVACS